MRWITESALVHTAVWLEDAVTGLGLNDVLPRCPTMFTCPAVAGGGVGPGFGPGSLYPPPPPQLATSSARAQTAYRVGRNNRIATSSTLRSTIDTNQVDHTRNVSGVSGSRTASAAGKCFRDS